MTPSLREGGEGGRKEWGAGSVRRACARAETQSARGHTRRTHERSSTRGGRGQRETRACLACRKSGGSFQFQQVSLQSFSLQRMMRLLPLHADSPHCLSYSEAQLIGSVAPHVPQPSARVGRTVFAFVVHLSHSLRHDAALSRLSTPARRRASFIEQHVTRRAFTRSCGGLTVKDGSPTWRRATGGARACRRLETGVARGGRAQQRRCFTSRSCARCSRGCNPLR